MPKTATLEPPHNSKRLAVPAAPDITLPAAQRRALLVTIKGLSPLVSNRMTEESIAQMAGKITGEAGASTRGPRKAEELAMASTHRTQLNGEDVYAHPSSAIFQAVIAGWAKGMRYQKKSLMTGFRMTNEMMVLDVQKGRVRRDAVKQAMTTSVRYRYEYTEWSATFGVVLYEATLSEEHFLQALQFAGERIGIGPKYMREAFGFGRFQVVSVARS
jgi:hypothetical protein